MSKSGKDRNNLENLIEVRNFECAIIKEIRPGGRISGFTDYIGKKALVIVLKEEEK